MCRICGVVNFNDLKFSHVNSKIKAMMDSMVSGGPDDSGVFVDEVNQVCFGHRRLSILDLSEFGKQPMQTADGSLVITYNGEIYNFKLLRSRLISLGYIFKSNTDTEVILYSYKEWGVECFDMFEGMFAFCLYDKLDNRIYLVRDHAGIKPLYYKLENNQLLFSSEVRPFYKFNNSLEEDENWKIYFLAYGFIPEPYTTIKNVYMLPKGSYLEFDITTKHYSIYQYVNNPKEFISNDIHEVREELNRRLKNSVANHLISDAKIGVFLSGGIDSSIIAKLSHLEKESELNTLSVVFNEKEYSEKMYQDIVVNDLKCKHNSYLVTENDFIDNLENIFDSMDQPTNDGINSYFISKCAKENGLKAVLSGIGADELFGGYPSFSRAGNLNKLYKVKFILSKLASLFEFIPDERYKRLSSLSLNNTNSLYQILRGFYSIDRISHVLDFPRDYVMKTLNQIKFIEFSEINKSFISLIEEDIYMKNQLLKDTDFMSMSNSIEVRVPFLDRSFMNYVKNIQEKTRFDSKIPKKLLIDSNSQYLDSQIINRKKQGFTFPFKLWFENNINVFKGYMPSKPFSQNIINKFQDNKLHGSRFWSFVVLNQKFN